MSKLTTLTLSAEFTDVLRTTATIVADADEQLTSLSGDMSKAIEPIILDLFANGWNKPVLPWLGDDAQKSVPTARQQKVASVRNSLIAIFAMGDAKAIEEITDALPDVDEDDLTADDIARYITKCKGTKGRIKTTAKVVSVTMARLGFKERKRDKKEVDVDAIVKQAKDTWKLPELGKEELLIAAYGKLCDEQGSGVDYSALFALIPNDIIVAHAESIVDSAPAPELAAA